MSDQQLGSNKKRPNDESDPEQNKSIKIETPEASNVLLNITLLDNDCLEHIFKKLNPNDLVSLADSSKCFKQACNLAYASKYGNAQVCIFGRYIPRFRSISVTVNYFAYDSLNCFSLVRCFGNSIHNLKIYYNNRNWTRVEQYINEYCVSSLKSIELWNAPANATEHFTKPFLNVEKVGLFEGSLDTKFIDLSKLFPQMQDLKFLKYKTFDFLNLQKLSSLRSLTIAGNDMTTQAAVQSVSEHLQCLESLNITFDRFDVGDNDIVFKNLEHLTLTISGYDSATKFPFVCDKLKTLALCTNQFHINNNFIQLIVLHRSSLTKLSIKSYDSMINPFLNLNQAGLATTVELLTDIDLYNCHLLVNEVIEILSAGKMLKTFRFRLKSISDKDNLQKRVNGAWRVSIEDYVCVKLER